LLEREESTASSEDGFVQCIVEMTEVTGADSYVYTKVGDTAVIARTDPDTVYMKDEKPVIGFNMNKVHFFEVQSGASISAGGDEG
jgi:multiple sugar transport system ATP-binding protein